MITISSIVKRAREAFGTQLELCYSHPVLYLVCKDPTFSGLDDDARREIFARRTGLPADVASLPSLTSTISLVLVTQEERVRDYEFLDAPSPGQHWLPLLDRTCVEQIDPVPSPKLPAIHFYGYKGGQARSTVLVMLAQNLADDGYKVLVVDVDIEAPSLDIILNAAASSPAQTLLGLVATTDAFEPLSVYTPRTNAGRVDMLACRPASHDYDMDFAAFALRTALDVTTLEEGIKRLRKQIEAMPEKSRYDVVLFDHRSGLATSVLPVIKAHPGPAVICLRIDEQSSGAGTVFNILLGHVRETPGAYVSFSLDPDDTRDKMLGTNGARINVFLDLLGAAIERGSTEYAGGDKDLPPEDFQRYWIPWFLDRAFLSKRFPALSDISADNRQSLSQLREVLGVSERKKVAADRVRTKPLINLSSSGAGDEGPFIETQEIARLLQSNTPITYIFGRKGTGKTRLLRELQARRLGEPLLVAADAKGGGLPSSDAAFQDFVSTFEKNPDNLWWAILGAALESGGTEDASFRSNLKKWERRASQRGRNSIRVSEIAEMAEKLPKTRVFLIDGVETAFRAAKLIAFVESLFRFLLTIQSDASFNGRVVVRLFLRTDLARRAIQNVEQQTAGRRLDLTWNTQSIFNFVLSRIARLEWFRNSFPEACSDIDNHEDSIRAGLLPASEYEPLLLEIFPRHLRRNNLQTLTFLKTYFSDAAGDDETRAAFYPRLFDAFLHLIAHPENLPHGTAPTNAIEDNRIHQSLVLAAHEAASRKFLDEVTQELSVLLTLSERATENEQRVSKLIQAFDGLKTPFVVEVCLKELRSRVANVKSADLREALQRMKELGMFEDRPGYPGSWRAGRLFKAALRMKYVR